MSLHRLIKINRRKALYVKSRQPHCAYEHKLKRIRRVFESIFNVLSLGCDFIHLGTVRRNIKPLRRELLILVRFFGNDNCHLHSVHIVDHCGDLISFLFCGGFVSLGNKFFLFLNPIVLNLIIHLYGSIFIHRYYHCFATETTTRQVMHDISCNFIKSVITLDNLKDSRRGIFKELRFGFVEIFILDNIKHIVVKKIVFKPNLRYSTTIKQRYGRAIFDRLRKVIF